MTDQQPARPPDVDTGFWLWVVALPLMVIGYLLDAVVSPTGPTVVRIVVAAMIAVVLSTVVVTFLLLMRAGYRWACTLLTGGGCASVVYVVSGLFTVQRAMPMALLHAAATIVGSVLIGGGTYLLHRKDAHAYFTR